MRKLTWLLLVLALITAACSGGAAFVGSVGEVEFTEQDIGALYESNTLPVDETLRQTIFAILAEEILLQGLGDDFEMELDEAEVEVLFQELTAGMEASGLTPADALGIPNASIEMVRFNAELGVIRQQAIDGLIRQPETIEAYFSDPLAVTTVCVRHILVETEEQAAAVAERLGGGEDFADVATEVSLDAGTPGGDLGCSPASRYVPEFAQASLDAELGELFGPVQTQFGFHLLIVDDRTVPSVEDVIADPLTHLTDEAMNALWGEWFNEKLQAAEVVVDPRFGAWSPIGIVPPENADLVEDAG